MPDTTPSQIASLTLDLTALAAHIVAALDHHGPGTNTVSWRRALVDAWEDTTGLEGDAPADLARLVITDPHHFTAAVVPF